MPATDESFLFIARFISAILSPFYALFVFKYLKIWICIIFVFLFGGFSFLMNMATCAHISNLADPGNRAGLILLLAAGLNIAWIIAIIFQPWLIFRCFAFYAGIQLIDLGVVVLWSFMKSGEIITCSAIAALRGFFIQLFILNVYVYAFYDAHAELPSIFKRFVLPDLCIFVVLMLITSVVAYMKKTGKRDGEISYPPSELVEYN